MTTDFCGQLDARCQDLCPSAYDVSTAPPAGDRVFYQFWVPIRKDHGCDPNNASHCISEFYAGTYDCPCCTQAEVHYASTDAVEQQRDGAQWQVPPWLYAFLVVIPVMYVAAWRFARRYAIPEPDPPGLPAEVGELLWPRLKSCSPLRLFAPGWRTLVVHHVFPKLMGGPIFRFDGTSQTWVLVTPTEMQDESAFGMVNANMFYIMYTVWLPFDLIGCCCAMFAGVYPDYFRAMGETQPDASPTTAPLAAPPEMPSPRRSRHRPPPPPPEKKRAMARSMLSSYLDTCSSFNLSLALTTGLVSFSRQCSRQYANIYDPTTQEYGWTGSPYGWAPGILPLFQSLPPFGHMLTDLPFGSVSPALAVIVSSFIIFLSTSLVGMGRTGLFQVCETLGLFALKNAVRICFLIEAAQRLGLAVVLYRKCEAHLYPFGHDWFVLGFLWVFTSTLAVFVVSQVTMRVSAMVHGCVHSVIKAFLWKYFMHRFEEQMQDVIGKPPRAPEEAEPSESASEATAPTVEDGHRVPLLQPGGA